MRKKKKKKSRFSDTVPCVFKRDHVCSKNRTRPGRVAPVLNIQFLDNSCDSCML